MANLHLHGSVPLPVSEERKKAVEPRGQRQLIEHFAAKHLEPTVDVAKGHASDEAHEAIEGPGAENLEAGVLALAPPAPYEVISFPELVRQTRDIRRVLREVGVQPRDEISARPAEPGRQSHGFAKIAPESNAAKAGVLGRERPQDCRGAIGA